MFPLQRRVARSLSAVAVVALVSSCSNGDGEQGGGGENPVPGTLEFSAAAYAVAEDGATATITVTRTGGSDGDVSVEYATSDGTATEGDDYVSAAGTLTWADGDASDKTFTVSVADDAVDESDETVQLTVTSPTGGAALGARDAATLTITDNDEPPKPGALQFSEAQYAVEETALEVTITVTREGGSDGEVTVEYSTSDDTATDGDDYDGASGTLTWPDGDTTDRTFTVTVLEDAVDEGDELVGLALASPTGGATLGAQDSASIVIQDIFVQGTVQFEAPSYITEEDAFTVSVKVTRTDGSDGAISVLYASRDGNALAGSDYTAISGRLTWEHNDSSERVVVLPVTADAEVEGDESLALYLVAPTGGATLGSRNIAPVTIIDGDTPAAGVIQFSAASYDETEDGISVTVTATRTGGFTGAADVTLVDAGTGTATSGSDYDGTFSPAALSWGDGDFADRFVEISIIDDIDSEPVETIDLTLQAVGVTALGTQKTAVARIIDVDPSGGRLQFRDDVYAGYEPDGPVTVTLERVGGAVGQVTVDYATSDGTAAEGLDYTGASGTITWEDGDEEPKSFTVPILEDVATEGGESVALTLTNPQGGAVVGPRGVATLIIVDNEPPGGLLQFVMGTYEVNEADGTATIPVSRTVGSQGEVSVEYATIEDTALDGADYTGTTGTLTWGDGDVAAKSFSVEILNDDLAEGTVAESVALVIGNVAGDAALGVPNEAILKIIDDETPPPGRIQFTDAAPVALESSGEATITISRTGGDSGPATVSFRTANGTATPSDYQPLATVISWADGDSADKTVTITIKSKGKNLRTEGPETVNLLLFGATGATLGVPSTAVLTIED